MLSSFRAVNTFLLGYILTETINVCSDISTTHFVGKSRKCWRSFLVLHKVITGFCRNKGCTVTNSLDRPSSAQRIVLSGGTGDTFKQHYSYKTLKPCRMWNFKNFHSQVKNFFVFCVKDNYFICLSKSTRKFPHLKFLAITFDNRTHTGPHVIILWQWFITIFSAQLHFLFINKTFCQYCKTLKHQLSAAK